MKQSHKDRSDYQSYLLRLWREGAHRPWRASLQGTAEKEMHHFATVEALFAFLEARLDAPANETQRHEPPPE